MTYEKTIYFAGSIRGGRDDKALYIEIINHLREYGTVLTEHVGDLDLTVTGETLNSQEIHDRDLNWLKQSTCVVAEVSTPSLGVGYEIAKALEWEKPVLCLFRPGEGHVLSAMIRGCRKVSLREYRIVSELKNLLDNFFEEL